MTDNVSSSRIGWHKWMRAIILGSVCVVCVILVGLNNIDRIRLVINQRTWASMKPAGYYMVVDENWIPKGHWLWTVAVQGERSIEVKLLESPQLSPNLAVPSGPTVSTIEKAFELGQACARSVLDCRLEFDPQYHYPRLIGYSDVFEIQVKQFTPCGESTHTCPSAEEFMAK